MYFEKFLECIVSTAKRLTCLTVVYLLIPTSNHNNGATASTRQRVVYLLIPTSNHNHRLSRISFYCCLSLDSYIKPQLLLLNSMLCLVVYLLIPTSNHNRCLSKDLSRLVVYLLIPTSNHNSSFFPCSFLFVVYLLIPTSNHNSKQ